MFSIFHYPRFRQRSKERKGQGLVEYALILVLVAIVVIAVVTIFGRTIAASYCTIVVQLNRARATACANPVVTCNASPVSGGRIVFEAVVIDPDKENNVDLSTEIDVTFYRDGNSVRVEEIEKFCLGGGGDGATACNDFGVSSGQVIRAVATDQDGNTGECSYRIP